MTLYTVSQVNDMVKSLLDGDARLVNIIVRGEASNYRIYPSGHHYFTLMDENSVVKCVMFRGDAGRVRFTPKDGMKLIVTGRVTVYPRDGQYQLYCTGMQPDGAGDLALAFEQLKSKLDDEGLFDPAHKKPLPLIPERVALVTSPAGAAVRDMIRILGRRWPLCEVIVVPVRVQGAEASLEIADALRLVNEQNLADVIITGRGGGSLEDLWAFNEERVARAIFASAIPVVSAVGHEPDVTIADYAADVRAATPSHAAEIVAPDSAEWARRLAEQQSGVLRAARFKVSVCRMGLEQRGKLLKSPQMRIDERRMRLDSFTLRLYGAAARKTAYDKSRLETLSAKLAALDPEAVLARGYALVYDGEGNLLRDAEWAKAGMPVRVKLSKGSFDARVE